MAKGFNGAPLFVKLGIVFTAIGLLLYIIGIATPYWNKYGYVHNGLWTYCYNDYCVDLPDQSWLEAARAFAIIGVLAGGASLLLILLHLFIDQLDKKIVYVLAVLLGFAACGCALLSVIIFGSKSKHHLHWSFGLTIVGALFHGAAAVMLLISMLQK